MLHRIVITLVGSLTCISAAGQSLEGGARAVGLGGATTALSGELWGAANPAAVGALAGPAAGFFSSQAYGLSALRLGSVALAWPFGWGSLGASARTYGFDAYRETHLGLRFARALALGSTRAFHAGLALHYASVSIPGYGTAGAIGAAVGGLVEVVPQLHFGFHLTNVNAPEYAEGEALPRTFALGLAYRPQPSLAVVADVEKDVRHPAAVRAGVEVWPVGALALRAGTATAPARFSAGVGLRLGALHADLAAERHEVLGWSPAVALSVGW